MLPSIWANIWHKEYTSYLVFIGSLIFVGGLALAHSFGWMDIFRNISITQGETIEGVTEYRLKNGLKILLIPDQSQSNISLALMYNVGFRNDPPQEPDLTHLLEHTLFQGTPSHPELMKEFEERGIQTNAFTFEEYTRYFMNFTSHAENLKWALAVEADRMRHVRFDKKKLETEMEIVQNEHDRYQDSPGTLISWRLNGVRLQHPYAAFKQMPPEQREMVLENKLIALKEIYHQYYRPDNAILTLSGKFDVAQSLEWIKASFGPLVAPKKSISPETATLHVPPRGEQSVYMRHPGESQIVKVNYTIPGTLHLDNQALTLVGEILASAPSGRLYQKLVAANKGVTAVWYDVPNTSKIGTFSIMAEMSKSAKVEEVKEIILSEIENFYLSPPTQEETDRAQRKMHNLYHSFLENSESLAYGVTEAERLGGWQLLFKIFDQTAQITGPQMAKTAEVYLRRDNRNLGIFIPADNLPPLVIPPPPSAAEILKDFIPPKAREDTLAFDDRPANIDAHTVHHQINGIKLAIFPKKNRTGRVQIAMQFRWGDEKSLFGKKIIAEVTERLLVRGTEKLDIHQFSDAAEALQINGGLMHFNVPQEKFPEALRLIASALKTPSLTEKEFNQVREGMIASLEQEKDVPEWRARYALNKHVNLYPSQDWRGTESAEEALAELKNLRVEDVRAYHKNFYGASVGFISIVGEIVPQVALDLVKEEFGTWESHSPYAALPYTYKEAPPLRFNLNTPKRDNAVYLSQLVFSMSQKDPDYPTLLMGLHLLNQRLFNSIRLAEGLSYEIHANLSVHPYEPKAMLNVYATAGPKNISKLEQSLSQHLQKMLQEGFTEDELNRSRASLLEQLQVRDDAGIAMNWINLLEQGYTFQRVQWLQDHTAKLTLAQVNEVFRKYVQPEKFSVALIGEGVQEGVQEAAQNAQTNQKAASTPVR